MAQIINSNNATGIGIDHTQEFNNLYQVILESAKVVTRNQANSYDRQNVTNIKLDQLNVNMQELTKAVNKLVERLDEQNIDLSNDKQGAMGGQAKIISELDRLEKEGTITSDAKGIIVDLMKNPDKYFAQQNTDLLEECDKKQTVDFKDVKDAETSPITFNKHPNQVK